MEDLNEFMRDLEAFEGRLGSKGDSRQLRTKMNETKTKAIELVRIILDLLKELKDLQPKKSDDRDYKNKVQRRLQEAFNKQNKNFNELITVLQKKEKENIDLKKSMLGSRLKSSVSSSVASGDDDLEMAAQIQDLDFAEAMLKEREKDLQDVRRLAHELNLTAQFQAQKIAEGSNDLEIVENEVGFTENKTGEANTHLEKALANTKRASKKNLVICIAVTLLCGVVIAIVVSQRT